jgi:hypothetical protein
MEGKKEEYRFLKQEKELIRFNQNIKGKMSFLLKKNEAEFFLNLFV